MSTIQKYAESALTVKATNLQKLMGILIGPQHTTRGGVKEVFFVEKNWWDQNNEVRQNAAYVE